MSVERNTCVEVTKTVQGVQGLQGIFLKSSSIDFSMKRLCQNSGMSPTHPSFVPSITNICFDVFLAGKVTFSLQASSVSVEQHPVEQISGAPSRALLDRSRASRDAADDIHCEHLCGGENSSPL